MIWHNTQYCDNTQHKILTCGPTQNEQNCHTTVIQLYLYLLLYQGYFLKQIQVISEEMHRSVYSTIQNLKAESNIEEYYEAREAWAFNELRRYHTIQAQSIQLGLENVHFGKTHFRDLNIDARISN